jgi:(p)ppGpp synthase/HD superfamily hydrolase
VARIIYLCGGGTELVVAALLHDTVEDAAVALTTIQSEFGVRVAELVACVTRDPSGDTWREGRERTLVRLATADEDCLVLKCADVLDNIRSIRRDLEEYGEAVWQALRPRREISWYYGALSRLFARRLTTALGRKVSRDLEIEVRAVFE